MKLEFTIREYLQDNFSSFTLEELKEHFLTKFGVRVNKFQNKYIFKYDTILANYQEPITFECRGVILYFIEGIWSYHSVPFRKFFNIQEGKCELFNKDYFDKVKKNIRLVEKKDGSCIQLAFDIETNEWRASTLGSIETLGFNSDFDYTFSQLFWELYDNKIPLVNGNTYIFELCSKMNQIVTGYEKDHLTLLAVRKPDFSMYSRSELEEIIKDSSVSLPKFIDKIFDSLDEIVSFTEEESKKEGYGEIPEGFVLYDLSIGHPVGKSKNEKYIQWHSCNTGDVRFVKKVLIQAYFQGNIDDIYDKLTDYNKAYIDRLRGHMINLEKESRDVLSNVSISLDRKAFAIELKKRNEQVVKDYFGFFFEFYKKSLEGTTINLIDWFIEGRRYESNDVLKRLKEA